MDRTFNKIRAKFNISDTFDAWNDYADYENSVICAL